MVKVVFCQKVFYSYFGTMSLSAVLKCAGCSTELVMTADADKAAEEALALKPDMLAFSSLTATGEFEWAVAVAERYRKLGGKALAVFGGIHPTLFPEETMKHSIVDVLCRGEGEQPILMLADAVAKGKNFSKIEGLWVRAGKTIAKNGIAALPQDLDAMPFADRDLYQKYGYFNHPDSIDVLAGRACPFNCSFCYNHVFRKLYAGKGKFVRKRSVGNFIAELGEVKRKYAPKSLTFVDELFALEKGWLFDFLEKYRAKIALPFICSIRADTLDDETAEKLKEAGVWRVCVGLETGNEKLRNGILNKRLTNEQLLRAGSILKKSGIKFMTTNMLGLPDETVENGFETVELNRKMGADFVWYSVFQPYPELEITQRLVESKQLACVRPEDFNNTYFRGSLLDSPQIRQLVNLHKLFFPAFKLPWAKPIFRWLIKLPPNPLFDLVFILSFGWLQMRYYGRNPLQVLVMGLSNLKVFYEK